MTSGKTLLILVFQCCNWKAETWSNLEDTVHHAAWSQCGNHLIFATKNKVICNFNQSFQSTLFSSFVLDSIQLLEARAKQSCFMLCNSI